MKTEVLKRAYSIAEIRAAEAKVMSSGTPELELMDRAGRSLAEFVLNQMNRLKIEEVLFVCGGGNNGGDGFVAAQYLLEAGKEVQILCLAERFSVTCEKVKANYRGEVLGKIPRRRYALIVECLLGTGVQGAVRGDAKELINFINSSGAFVISCDLPGGLSEGGVASEFCVRANMILCIGGLKQALLLADGPDFVGEISVADIGLSPEGGAEVWESADVEKFFPARKSHVNKGSFGSSTIFAGICKYPNAPLFAAEACLKSGVGYTKLVACDMLFHGAIGKNAAMLQKFSGIDSSLLSSKAIALGMGAGESEALYDQIIELLKAYEGILVFDADALNVLASCGLEILKKKKCRVILTPHLGEFSRLIQKDIQEILPHAVKYAKNFAKEYDVCVVLKNNHTVITNGERVAINTTGSPALAKGGSGDVLSGFLAGTCARGIEPYEAACVSSYLLGRAGELAASEVGEYSVTALDIINKLPAAIRGLSGRIAE